MKVHKGKAQTNKVIAAGSLDRSSGAAEKKLATVSALSATNKATSNEGRMVISNASFTAP